MLGREGKLGVEDRIYKVGRGELSWVSWWEVRECKELALPFPYTL